MPAMSGQQTNDAGIDIPDTAPPSYQAITWPQYIISAQPEIMEQKINPAWETIRKALKNL